MKTGKIKPVSTMVLQFPAGVEVEVVELNGNVYFPFANFNALMEGSSVTETSVADEPTKKSAPKPAKDSAKEDAPEKTYTEDELTDMDVKTLTKILKDDFGVNPDDFDGKNTNKKLRLLILKTQEEGAVTTEDDGDDEDADDKPAAKKSAKKSAKKDEDISDTVGDLLEKFDEGDLKKKKVIDELVALGDDVDSDAVSDLLDEFADSEDSIEDWIEKIVAFIETGEAPKAKKSAPKKGKKEEKEELVAVEDLEVGDRVSVWWDNDEQDWFDGEVKSIKGKKVVILYDDDTEEKIDPKIHTKIKMIED